MGGGAVTNCPKGLALEEGSAGWSELAKAAGRGSYGKVLKFMYCTGSLAMDLWRRQEDGTGYQKVFEKCSRWNTYYFICLYI